MATVQKSVEVKVPLSVAYNQWTQFEEFPYFMDSVVEVRQLDDRHLHWVASVGGTREEWDAEIQEQLPDQRIAWSSIDGDTNAGVVTFEAVAPDRTRVELEIGYEPEGVIQSIGEALGVMDRQLEGDLERFKEFIESRGSETGAWRGRIP